MSIHNETHIYQVGFSTDFNKDQGVEHEKWIIWDRHIIKKIEYIFSNTRHAHGLLDQNRIFHPNKDNNERSLYSMIVSLGYHQDGIDLNFENYSKTSAKYIKDEAIKKNKLEKEHIINLGGYIDYSDEQKEKDLYLIRTTLFLPLP